MEENSNYKSEYSESKRFQETVLGKKQDGTAIVPFFIYEIKVKHHPFHLCFPKVPTKVRYENDIFNMLATLPSVGEAISCLKYHLDRYPSREDFLEFFRHTLDARIETCKSSERLITYKECLKWIEGQMVPQLPILDLSFLFDRIQTSQKEALVVLFRYLISDMDNSSPPEYGFKGGHLATAMLLKHFSSFDDSKVGTLQKEVSKCNAQKHMTPELQAELKKFFQQWNKP